jgi:hypothetical protein
MGKTDYGRQRLRKDMALLDIPTDRRAEEDDEVGFLKLIICCFALFSAAPFHESSVDTQIIVLAILAAGWIAYSEK